MSSDVIVRLQRRIDTLEAEKVSLQKQVTGLQYEVSEYRLQLRQNGGGVDMEMRFELHNKIGLTPFELKLLFLLVSREEGFTKDALMIALYDHAKADEDIPEIKIVDVYICKLRKKLSERAFLPRGTIETIWGRGYRIAEEHRPALEEHLGIAQASAEA